MKLIILDVDETLVHSCPEWIGRKPDFMAAEHMMFVRPHAKEFIDLLLQNYKVAVWTASYGKYTREILSHLFTDLSVIEFIWDRNVCTLSRHDSGVEYFAKELSRLAAAGWDDDDWLIIDDMPDHIVGDRTNIIGIKPWFGSVNDEELRALSKQFDLE